MLSKSMKTAMLLGRSCEVKLQFLQWCLTSTRKWRDAVSRAGRPQQPADAGQRSQRESAGQIPRHLYCSSRNERWGRFWRRPDHPLESAALQKLAPLATPAGHFVLSGADGLFGAARRLDGQQVAVPVRCDEADNLVFFAELDEQHAFARP